MASPYSRALVLESARVTVRCGACGVKQKCLRSFRRQRKISCAKKQNAPEPCLGRGVVFYKRECIPLSTFLSREIFKYFCFSLNSFLFRSIVPQFPSQFHLARPPASPGSTQVEEDTCPII